MTTSITTALGAGSGIDTRALVESLATAAAAPARAALDGRESANRALLSALGEAGGALDALAKAMNERVQAGGLRPTLVPSDGGAVSVGEASGAVPAAGLTLEVLARASSQTNVTLPQAVGARFGPGTIAIQVGDTETRRIDIAAEATMEDIPRALANAGAGVSAQLFTDASGQRLSISGPSGAASGFTIAVEGGDDRLAGLFDGAVKVRSAADARIRIDGVELTSASDRFVDVVGGATLTVTGAAPGARITLTPSRPDTTAASLLSDFADAYNELLDRLTALSANRPGEAVGAARGNPALREMIARLRTLTTTPLGSGGDGPGTLAELGLKTQRDGKLSFDRAQLDQVLLRDPQAVARILLPAARSDSTGVRVTSDPGRVLPGAYALTDLALSPEGIASGRIDGVVMQAFGDRLVAPSSSRAPDLSSNCRPAWPPQRGSPFQGASRVFCEACVTRYPARTVP